ncbi:MAG: hypothetical protein K0Q74_1347, partial [Gammaproteobacteria bacterium]|nr:hypothetical protein [Gammaproteobacteria bacterium]
MANERTHTTQEYYLSLTQFTPSDLDQAASVMEKEDRKEDDQTLLFQILQGKKSNIPTLVKFIDAQGSHHYYLFGLSENGTEILTPIPTNLEGASAAINATYHPLRLSAKLDGINFSTYKGGRPRSLLISAANEDNSEIYEAILSLAPDHSFFPALIHRHIPELVGAFASLPKNRNKSICNTVLKLGIDLIEYFKTKKLALSPEIIANFMQNIGILYFSPETSTQLFSHIGAINRLHDNAYLALHRSKRSLQDDDEDEEYDRQPQGFIGSLRDVINKLFNSGYQELQQDNKQESKEDGNYSSTAKQQRTLSKLTEPADMGLDDIYKQPTTEQERIAQAFYVAGEVLRNISDSVTDQKPNPFSALLTPEILNAYSIASNTESAIREDLLPLPTEKPHAAVAAESLKKDDKDNAEPNKTALIIYGRSLLEALEQNNPDPKMIVDAFITLLTKLSATETDDKISNLAKDLSLGEILAALRKHHDIFRQLRNTVNTFS